MVACCAAGARACIRARLVGACSCAGADIAACACVSVCDAGASGTRTDTRQRSRHAVCLQHGCAYSRLAPSLAADTLVAHAPCMQARVCLLPRHACCYNQLNFPCSPPAARHHHLPHHRARHPRGVCIQLSTRATKMAVAGTGGAREGTLEVQPPSWHLAAEQHRTALE